jgi:hypothetical protein
MKPLAFSKRSVQAFELSPLTEDEKDLVVGGTGERIPINLEPIVWTYTNNGPNERMATIDNP